MADQTKKCKIFEDLASLNYGYRNRVQLYSSAKDNLSLIQRLKVDRHLKVHNGCVNTICWSDSGQHLLSGSDDQHLVISNPFTGKTVVSFRSAHRANIFCAKFLPNCLDRQLVSCSGDGMIYHTDVLGSNETCSNGFDCHDGAVYELLTIPNDSHSFLSCGEDGTVRWFDLRSKSRCNKEQCKEDVMITCRRAVMSLASNPVLPYHLAVACSDNWVRIYDRRMLGTRATGGCSSHGCRGLLSQFTAPSLPDRCHRITSIVYSHDGSELLVSYSSEHIYLFALKATESSPCRSSVELAGSLTTGSDAAAAEEGAAGPVVGAERPAVSPTPSSQSRAPPIKRLRLRGDWSDTGPNARPERDRAQPVDPAAATVMQRMSDMLTRWLEGAMRRAEGEEGEAQDDNNNPPGADQPPNPDASSSQESDAPPASNFPAAAESTSASNSEQSCVKDLTSLPMTTADNKVSDDCDKDSPLPSFAEKLDSDSEQYEKVPTAHETSSQSCDEVVLPSSTEAEISANDIPISMDVSEVSKVCEDGSRSTTESAVCEVTTEISDRAATSVESSSNLLTYCAEAQQSHDDLAADTWPSHNSFDSPEVGEVSLTGAVEMGFSAGSSVVIVVGDNEASNASNDRIRAGFPTESSTPNPSGSLSDHMDDEDHPAGGATAATEAADDVSDNDSLSTPSSSAHQSPSHGRSARAANRDDCDLDIERHLAAIQLQEMFRKRQVSKEAKQLAARPSPLHPVVRQVYKGHRNSRTMIKKAAFWGSRYVMSGSDCGHIFVWDRETAQLVMLLEGDKHVVNCLQPHPFFPVLASSGIDYDIKLWMPTNEGPDFDEAVANELMRRNEIMLDETRDTLTVPATFMLRMLSSLSHARRAGAAASAGAPPQPDDA